MNSQERKQNARGARNYLLLYPYLGLGLFVSWLQLLLLHTPHTAPMLLTMMASSTRGGSLRHMRRLRPSSWSASPSNFFTESHVACSQVRPLFLAFHFESFPHLQLPAPILARNICNTSIRSLTTVSKTSDKSNISDFFQLSEKFRNCKPQELSPLLEIADEAQNVLESVEPRLAFLPSTAATEQNRDTTTTLEDSLLIDCSMELLQMWVMLIKSFSKNRKTRGLPQRAQYLLTRLEDIVDTPPSIDAYNLVLEAWAYSQEHLRGSMAYQFWDQRIRVPMNAQTYAHLIHAWTSSGEKRAAWAAKHLLIQQALVGFELPLEYYHKVFECWTNSKEMASPMKAHGLLQFMDERAELSQVHPDLACYRAVLQTASGRLQVAGLGEMVDGILTQMKDRFVSPDAQCYAFAIKTWKNVVRDPGQQAESQKAVRRCQELLSTMKLESKKTSTDFIETSHVNDVMEAIAYSSHPRKLDLVLHMLHELEDSQELQPDHRSFDIALKCWSSSGLSERLFEASSVFTRFINCADARNRESATAVLNSFLEVCSGMEYSDNDGMKVVRQALSAVESVRSSLGTKPTPETYLLLLNCCVMNTKPNQIRDKLIENIFHLCCKDGMVNDHILKSLRKHVSSDTFARLVVEKSEWVEGIRVVPEKWTVNALGLGRVVTADGRRATPLSIQGDVTETKTMKDFRMRRLRDHRNRNLLQGGRLKRPNMV